MVQPNIIIDFRYAYNLYEQRNSDKPVYQWDLGRKMEMLVPVTSVVSAEVHFFRKGMEKASAYIPELDYTSGDDYTKVMINVPNFLFERQANVSVYVVITDENQNVTTFNGVIPVIGRAMPDDYVDDNPENDAVQILKVAKESAEESELWAKGTVNGVPVEEGHAGYHDNSKYYKEKASESAHEAKEAAETFEVDPTLTKEGKPADAKAVGDRLLKEDGYYPDMHVGIADNIEIEGDAIKQEFLKRTSAASFDIQTGIVPIDKIIGNSIVSDSKIKNLNFQSIKTVGFNLFDPNRLVESGWIDLTPYGSPGVYEGKAQYLKNAFYDNDKFLFEKNYDYDGDVEISFEFTNTDPSLVIQTVNNYIDGAVSYGVLVNRTNNVSSTFKKVSCIVKGRNVNDSLLNGGIKLLTQSNGYYMKIRNFCVSHYWSGSREGDYEDYTEHLKNIPISTYFSDGMKSAGNIFDELTTTKAVKRVNSCNMAMLNWIIDSTNVFKAVISDMISDISISDNLLSNIYVITDKKSSSQMPDKSMFRLGNYVFIKDIRYNTIDDLVVGLVSENAELNYQLLNLIETDISPQLDLSYTVDDFGTEEIIPSEDTAPFIGYITYKEKVSDLLRNLPVNYISKKSMDDFCIKIGEKTGHNIQASWNDSTNSYDFSVTPKSSIFGAYIDILQHKSGNPYHTETDGYVRIVGNTNTLAILSVNDYNVIKTKELMQSVFVKAGSSIIVSDNTVTAQFLPLIYNNPALTMEE